MPVEAQESADLRTMGLLAFSATAGVLVEYYDFFVFGYAAASVFPKVFFPNLSPTTALVFAYLTYGAGFPARLLGAFIFGHFGDRAGRKYSFLINILVVGVTTCLVGLLPGYQTLGLLAPTLLVLLRIIQGIGLGGEFGGASSLLAEFGAKRRHRAFWVSLANLGIPGGAIAATIVMFVLSDSFMSTGWRVAMLLSVVIVVPALLARYKLADSPLFEQLKQREQLATLPSFGVLRRYSGPTMLLALVLAFQVMDGAVSGTYVISFMQSAGIPLATTAAIIFVARIGDAAGVFISGPFADLWNRKLVAYLSIGITTVLSYPYVLAILEKQIAVVMVLQFFITLLGIGVLHGLAPILTSESFPTKYRYSGAGISYNLAGILGGTIAPSFLAGSIGQNVFQNWHFLPIVYAGYCIVAVLALLFTPETRGVPLEELDSLPEES